MFRFPKARFMVWLERFLDDPPDLGFFRRWFDQFYLRPYFNRQAMISIAHAERLPEHGPAIFVANHESLVDAAIIQFCYPLSWLATIRPTGARDFFKRKGLIARFMAGSMMRICFIDRESGEAAKRGEVDPFASCHAPLRAGNMLIYFPQGTRGEGVPFQAGIYHLVRQYPEVPVVPVRLAGTRHFHPKGVPFWKFFPEYPVSMWVGEPFPFDSSLSPRAYAAALEHAVYSLGRED